MKKILFLVIAFVSVFTTRSNSLLAANDSVSTGGLEYLEKTFPKLTNLYKEELSKYPAHYIFAIDVSGTMNQYEEMVVNSIIPFFNALPNGDCVDVIPFGTEALSSMANYSGVIDPQVKSALNQNITRLYNDPSYPEGF